MLSTSTRPAQVKLVSLSSSSSRFGSVVFLETTHTHTHTGRNRGGSWKFKGGAAATLQRGQGCGEEEKEVQERRSGSVSSMCCSMFVFSTALLQNTEPCRACLHSVSIE